MAPVVHSVEVADSPEAWESAGFTVVDSAVRLGDVLVELKGGSGGVLGWTLRDVDPAFFHAPEVRDAEPPWDLDGVPTHIAAAPHPPDTTAPHPNGASGLDVVILRSPNPARTLAALGTAGLESRAENGPETRKARKIAQYFIRPPGSPCTVELVGPDGGDGEEGAELGGMTVVCEDIDATHAALSDSTKPPWDAVQKDRRMTVLQGKKHGVSIPMALISPHVKDTTPQEDRDARYAERTKAQLAQLEKDGGTGAEHDTKARL